MRGHHNNHARAEKGSSTVVHKGRGSGSNDADQGLRLNASLRESVQLYGPIDERCVPCRENNVWHAAPLRAIVIGVRIRSIPSRTMPTVAIGSYRCLVIVEVRRLVGNCSLAQQQCRDSTRISRQVASSQPVPSRNGGSAFATPCIQYLILLCHECRRCSTVLSRRPCSQCWTCSRRIVPAYTTSMSRVYATPGATGIAYMPEFGPAPKDLAAHAIVGRRWWAVALSCRSCIKRPDVLATGQHIISPRLAIISLSRAGHVLTVLQTKSTLELIEPYLRIVCPVCRLTVDVGAAWSYKACSVDLRVICTFLLQDQVLFHKLSRSLYAWRRRVAA